MLEPFFVPAWIICSRVAGAVGYHALAIADECTVAGVLKGNVAAKEANLKLVIGSQMVVTVEDGTQPF